MCMVVKFCTFWSVCFRGELGFLNCDAICMCVVIKQFEPLEFVFDSVYVDRQYDGIFFFFFFLLGLCDVCGRPWSVCEVVLVPYVDAVVTVTVMRVLLFVLHVCMLRECKGAMVWGPGRYGFCEWGCEYIDWTRDSGFVSTADDVLEISVVRGLGGVCVWIGAWGRRCGGNWVKG